MHRTSASPPDNVVFDTAPIPLAVREPLPGVGLSVTAPRPATGAALWLAVEDADALHDHLVSAGVEVLGPAADSPFGRMLTFIGPEDCALTTHTARQAAA